MTILFDFDGTLVDQRRDVAFEALVKAHATYPSQELAADICKKDIWLCSHEIYDRTVLFKLYQGHFGDLHPIALCGKFWEEVKKSQRPKTGCVGVLTKLQERHRIFCATDTDGPSSNKQSRVQASGLERFFEEVFIGSEAGLPPKGTAAYIETILQRIPHSRDGCVFIGDKVKADLMPAHAVGMRSILMHNPDYPDSWALQVEELAGILPMVEKLDQGITPPPENFVQHEQAWWQQRKASIDNESRALILVGCAMRIVGEAGQIFRGYTNGDHGIDGEIEFKDHHGRASGLRLYLQLKSGDSYLAERQRDGADIYRIKKDRWTDYWQQQACPVMLVIRTSDGDIRWMNVTEYLQDKSSGGIRPKQVEFTGERFDVASLLRWREKMLNIQ